MSVPAHLHKVPADAELTKYAVCPACGRRQTTYTFWRDDGLHWFCSGCGHQEIEPKAEDKADD